MSPRTRWWLGILAVLLLALTLRGLWLTADPPTADQTGIVWHDEGAWTHNARNMALWGQWRTDEWNPLFIAPVFTALEYVSFAAFGVGTWQARLVPVVSGLFAILALMVGLERITGRRAACLGGLLLATSFTFVTWNRAALMESTMTAFITLSWAAYAAADRRPWWGLLAGLFAVAAFFTKAAAAFFIAALMVEVATRMFMAFTNRPRGAQQFTMSPSPHVLMGLAAGAFGALLIFVAPHWTEFQFYNWQMTVTRKPTYSVDAFIDRATWLPLVHGVFTRMWLVLIVAAVTVLATVRRWWDTPPAIRLAVLWITIGLLELVIHDAGNERRYVMFVPALIALAVSADVKSRTTSTNAPLPTAWVCLAAVPLTYLLAGSLLRLLWLDDVLGGNYSQTVRVSAVLAVVAGGLAWTMRVRMGQWLDSWRPSAAVLVIAVTVTVATDLTLYARWASTRTYANVEASRQLGGLLPAGTLVHGKLANGLALENRLRPLFVGREFGNYADRLDRPDARYILSYTEANGRPDPGFEGDIILDVLEHYPQRRIVTEFDVQETPGRDRAALIDKFPDGPVPRARDK